MQFLLIQTAGLRNLASPVRPARCVCGIYDLRAPRDFLRGFLRGFLRKLLPIAS